MIGIGLDKLKEAREQLKGKILYTPLVPIIPETSYQGHNLFLKAECLQPSGSFKIRGATYTLSKLSAQQKSIGVVAHSTGNHAQAVALASRRLGIKSIIVMSPEAPQFKIDATRNYGAEVVMTSPSSFARRKLAEEIAESKGYFLVDPYDQEDVITGQGTIGMEIAEQMEPAAVFVPVGGGGLICGIALAIKQIMPSVRIIGVEPELENHAYLSFLQGSQVTMKGPSDSIADAVKIQSLGKLTYPLFCHYVDDMMTVSEEEIANATLMILQKTHLMVEPSGAIALAGAQNYPGVLPKKKPVVCIASGGNTTLLYLNQLLRDFPEKSP